MGRRVVVTGASGDVGTSVVREPSADPAVDSVVVIARRAPDRTCDKVTWQAADLRDDDLDPPFAETDVIVHSPG